MPPPRLVIGPHSEVALETARVRPLGGPRSPASYVARDRVGQELGDGAGRMRRIAAPEVDQPLRKATIEKQVGEQIRLDRYATSQVAYDVAAEPVADARGCDRPGSEHRGRDLCLRSCDGPDRRNPRTTR